MWIRGIVCLLLVVIGTAAHAVSPDSVDVTYSYFYSESEQTLEDALQRPKDRWIETDKLGNYGFKSGEFWIQLNLVPNLLHDDNEYYVRFQHPVLDLIDIYIFSEGAQLDEHHLGDTVQNIERPVQEKRAAFKVTFPDNKPIDIYIRVVSVNAMLLTMEVMSEPEHELSVQVEVLISGLVYGVLLVMMFYNLGIAVSIRDKAYYFYVLYVASYVLFLLSLTGDGYYYLWPEKTEFNHYSLSIFSGFLMIPSLLFPYYLLNIKRYAPRIIPVFKVVLVTVSIYFISMPFMEVAMSLYMINIISVFGSIFMLGTGIYLSFNKVPIALIYTFAWFFLLFGLAILPLSSLGVIESNLMTRYSNMLGGVIEAVLLSLALAQRIRLERKERLEAIEQTLKLKEEAAEDKKIFQEIFEFAPIGMFRFTSDGKLVAVNKFLTELLGFKEPQEVLGIGLDMRDFFNNGYELSEMAINQALVMDQESVLTMRDGTSRDCSVTLRNYSHGNSDVIEGFITDISERKRAQKLHQIMEKQRMDTMEQLVTGVAHEINTPLGNNVTSISHISELFEEIEEKMDQGKLSKLFFKEFVTDCQSLMTLMASNLQKISSLIQRFKLVSVTQMDIEKAEINFKQKIEDTIEQFLLNNREVAQGIKFFVDVHGYDCVDSYPAAWKVILEQLLENTVIHGFDYEANDKKIMIELNYENECWQFSYQDNGNGLSEEIQDRIFDPFVTTKRGSADHAGLGMYRIYNVVKQVLKGGVKILPSDGFKLLIEFK